MDDGPIKWEDPDKLENELTAYLKTNINLIKPKHDKNFIRDHKYMIE